MSLDDASSVAPPSPEYVSDPMELEDHASVYVPEPKYIEYLAPSDDDIPMEDQPLPVEASPVALSPGYIADFDPEEDEEDPKEDPTNYPADGGDDDDDKSSDDDDDDDDEEEDEEHLAHANSTVVAYPAVDLLQHHSLLPTGIPPLLPIPLPAPSTSRKHGILEADMPLRKRLLLTAPTSSYEAGEISAAGATRQPGSIVARMVDNNFVDTTDATVMSSSTVTYTSYTDSEPWRFYGGSDEEPSDVGSPGVPYTDTDGLDVFGATPSLVYVPGPEPTHHSGLSAGLDHPPRTSYSPIHGFVLTLIRWRSERGQRRIILNYPADGRAVMNESLMVTMMIADDGDWRIYQEVSEDKDDEDMEEEHLAFGRSSVILVVTLFPQLGIQRRLRLIRYREARIRIRAASPPLLLPSTSHRTDIPEAEMLLWKRACFTTPAFGFEVGESSATAAAARQLGPTLEAALGETSETRQALARSKAHNRALEARMATMETQLHRMEWQHQDADDHAVRHIMRTQALEAGARIDTLEDTGSSS
ncbi:hypothetical protein Tco_1570751 [Tanacetum coccineum]